jgi:hypothetical protein
MNSAIWLAISLRSRDRGCRSDGHGAPRMAELRANLAIGTRATRLRKQLFHVQTQPNRKGVVGGSGDRWRYISKGRIVESCGTGTILC